MADASNAQTWRDGLEQVFDVYGFLRVLAINQAMVNWDSYGCMSHNYYVYSDPSDDGRIKWFPWDLNEAMLASGPDGRDEDWDIVLCNDCGLTLDGEVVRVLAAAVPFLAAITLLRALRGRFDKHAAIARWTLPIWLYVSVTGVLVYWMLYHL